MSVYWEIWSKVHAENLSTRIWYAGLTLNPFEFERALEHRLLYLVEGRELDAIINHNPILVASRLCPT